LAKGVPLRRISLWFSILAFIGAAGFASAAPLSSDNEWMGMYMLGQKVGYSHTSIEPAGKGSFRIQSDSVLRVALLGQSMEQRIGMTYLVTSQGKPLTLSMKMSSAGHDASIQAKYEPSVVRCALTTGGETTRKDVSIPKGVSLDIDPELQTGSPLKIGKPVVIYYFNPANLTIEKTSVEAVRNESITVGGIAYSALVVVSHTPMGDITAWEDKDGHSLREQSILGITMKKETREEALSLPSEKYAPPADLAKALAVDSGRDLNAPREASYLKIRLTSPDMPDPVSDGRQTVKRVDKDTVILTINAQPLAPKDAVTVAQASRLQPEWVKPAPYVQSDNPKIKALAKSIVKGETNAFWAAQKIRDWVHQNMKVDANIGVIRSGLDVYNDKRGVCRDFAMLYVTLARAAGLPTRIDTGLVYSEGAFYYHAWAESFVGRWIDIDPTLPTAFVDATHLKMGRGGAESLLSSGKVMGRLKAQTLDYRTGDTSS
jgi:hypothetical protein